MGFKKQDTMVITIGKKGEINGEVMNGPGGELCEKMLDEILDGLGETKAKGHKADNFAGNGQGVGNKVKLGR